MAKHTETELNRVICACGLTFGDCENACPHIRDATCSDDPAKIAAEQARQDADEQCMDRRAHIHNRLALLYDLAEELQGDIESGATDAEEEDRAKTMRLELDECGPVVLHAAFALAAARQVIDAWEGNDLAGAIRNLDRYLKMVGI